MEENYPEDYPLRGVVAADQEYVAEKVEGANLKVTDRISRLFRGIFRFKNNKSDDALDKEDEDGDIENE